MKKIQKFLSLILAMSIVLSLSTVFASAREKTGSSDENSTFLYDTQTGHTHDYELVSVISPTCGKDGGYFYKCKFCNDTYTTKNEHQFSHWYALQSGTETEEGIIIARKCNICGEITEQISPTIINGICGKNSEYELNLETGLATVSGSGSAEIAYLIDSEYSGFLKDVVFEEGIESVYPGDFYGNIVRVYSVTIPSSVECYSDEADHYMPADKIIVKNLAKFCATNLRCGEWSLLDQGLYPGRVLYYNGEAVANTLVVPSSVNFIACNTFNGYNYLTGVEFPENSDIFISNGAFANCQNLTSVIFRDPDAFAERGSFSGCTSLTDVYYYGTPEQLQELLEQADYDYDETIYETATIHYCSAPVNNGFVSDISYEPSINYKNRFSVKVNDRPNMVQLIELDCGNGTRSFDRFHKNVSIVSYDKDGNVVNSLSADLAYEIWTIETPLADGNIGVRVKASGSSKWESRENAYIFENKHAESNSVLVKDYLVRDSGNTTPTEAVIETTNDVLYVQLKFDNGTTLTYSKDKATLNENGNLVFNMKVWINHSGENVVCVRIYTAKGWQTVDCLIYLAE